MSSSAEETLAAICRLLSVRTENTTTLPIVVPQLMCRTECLVLNWFWRQKDPDTPRYAPRVDFGTWVMMEQKDLLEKWLSVLTNKAPWALQGNLYVAHFERLRRSSGRVGGGYRVLINIHHVGVMLCNGQPFNMGDALVFRPDEDEIVDRITVQGDGLYEMVVLSR